ncbi:O-antigen ligase family protein [Alteromonas confluentis]|uniref:O-antigen ligase-related domain-containing protein n=1 Tax=Alteromonas confluentis TaxID=1656094 RepID=A0A1E7ZF74_9ALTE|nr:O-antigen ligase family protein [Alteromonas confluentis]OFC72146.1 hypothetical protein BFC18_05455 [Alteromonas confluentis]
MTLNRLHTPLIFCFSVLFIVFPWLHGLDLAWEQLLFAGCTLLLFGVNIATVKIGKARQVKWISLAFLVWLVWCALYLLKLPASILELISPKTLYWYNLGKASDYYLSVYRQASLIEWFKFLTIPVLFWTIWLLVRSRRALYIIANAIVAGCTITAIYSLINFASDGAYEVVGSIPPWDLAWKDGIRGTFSYKNQYAMYLALCMALAAGLLAQNIVSRGNRKYSTLLTIQLLLLAVTLINTSSRGAIVSLVGGAGITFLLFIYRNRAYVKRFLTAKLLVSVLALFVVMGFAFSQSSVYDRFANQQLEDNGRTYLRQTAMGVISDHPLTGSGPGTYPFIQHVYKPMELGISKMSKRAHNDYLETLASTGIIGFTLLALPLGLLLLATFRNRNNESDGVLIGIRVAILTFLIQSSFDTNTGIFFLPVLFITVLSLGFIINFRNPDSTKHV